MRRIYLALVLLAFIALVIFGRHEFVCNMLGMCGDESITTSQGIAESERTKNLTFSIDGDTILKGYDQFAFANKSASAVINDNNTAFLTKILDYLNENPKADIKITGRYTSDEELTTTGIFENLGVGRAALIREWLTVRNIDARRITITSAQDENALNNPIAFEGIAPQNGVPNEYDNESVPRYTFEDMTYQFAYDSDKFIPNDAFKEYAEQVKTYLEDAENVNKTVIIVGHTCDMGKEMYNYNLGKDRAENAKSYFINKIGISKDKVFTDTRGMSKPMVPNDNNEENRKQNRRVNIQIED
jgi:outer membrane protein OmpA-like peptidoglycan-associated protein